MATQMLLEVGSTHWSDVAEAVTSAANDVLNGSIAGFTAQTTSGARIDGMSFNGGGLRLLAVGNDSLVGENRLTVRDERAVFAVGFSATTESWGSFSWEWTAPVDASSVASGIVRTMRDIYKADPAAVELHVTL